MQRSISARYLALLTGLLMLVSIVNVADKELLAPVVDAVKLDLGMSDTQIGMVRSSVFLAALLGQLFWGPLSDRWVRKYIIVIGTIIWSAITWMTAFVGNFPQLLMARAGMSFAEGCFNPSAYALLTDAAPKRNQGMMLGLMSITYPVGTAAALVIASAIGTEHWRQPFIIYGLIGIMLGVLVLFIVREPRRGANEEAVEQTQGEYRGKFSFAEFRKLLAFPSLLLGFGLDTCQSSVNWSLAFWAPTYLTRYHIARDAESASLALLPAIIGFVVGALLGGWLNDRLRTRSRLAPVWISLIAMASGLLIALLMFNLFVMGVVMAVAFMLGLVTYLVMPSVNIIFFSLVPPEMKATTISTSNVILNLVISILTFFIGMISDAHGLRLAFGGAIILMYALGIVASLALLRTYPQDVARRNTMVASQVAGK
jgi:MFS transporter, Spinster family, sphingosine-1-phosphate transporter